VSHHRLGWIVVVASLVVVFVDGLLFAAAEHISDWHGVYCIWMTGITVGGDVAPTGWGYACLALSPVPLLGAAFGLFTSALSAVNTRREVGNAKGEIMDHVESRLKHHLGKTE
jgi:hypothetical protein